MSWTTPGSVPWGGTTPPTGPGDGTAPSAPDAPGVPGAPGVPSAPGVPGEWPTPPVVWGPPGQGVVASRVGMLASYGQRVGAMLLDVLVSLVPWLVAGPFAWLTAERTPSPLGHTNVMTTTAGDWAILAALALQVLVWVANRWVVQGRTGQSLGKRVLGIRLADARGLAGGPGPVGPVGGPVGGGRTVGRELAHVLDWPGPLGFMWPLWDPLGQTFADEVTGTVVVRVR